MFILGLDILTEECKHAAEGISEHAAHRVLHTLVRVWRIDSKVM